MNTWLPVIILIVVVFSAGLLRERWRVSGIERWAKAKGFVRPVPFAPDAASPAARLAAQLHPRGARLWGVALDGMVDASPCAIAEYAASKPGTRSADEWFTLVAWPSTGAGDSDPSRRPGSSAWPHEGTLLREGSHRGWRLPGTMTAARLDQIVRLVPEARRHVA